MRPRSRPVPRCDVVEGIGWEFAAQSELIARPCHRPRLALRKGRRDEQSREDRAGAEPGVDDDRPPPIRARFPTSVAHHDLRQIVCLQRSDGRKPARGKCSRCGAARSDHSRTGHSDYQRHRSRTKPNHFALPPEIRCRLVAVPAFALLTFCMILLRTTTHDDAALLVLTQHSAMATLPGVPTFKKQCTPEKMAPSSTRRRANAHQYTATACNHLGPSARLIHPHRLRMDTRKVCGIP
jgi:hypothetical protein